MQQPEYLIYNGVLQQAGQGFISPDYRGFKFGDGLFETMKLVNGELALKQFHFERLFASMLQLGFVVPDFFTPSYLDSLVKQLAVANGHWQHARVRVTVFRGEGGLYGVVDHLPHTIIQTWEQPPATGLNEHGLVVGIFRDAVKAADRFSSIKSSNYQCYALAAMWANEQQLDDALLLNAWGRVADATIANVFVVHEGVVKTPPLDEGGINGVMRRYLLAAIRGEGRQVQEVPVTEEILAEASELFLTNALSGIRWVKSLGNNTYQRHLSTLLYNQSINARLW
ncbi:branched-chain amino acid aminotransferase [Filimonas lacunae]|uniref:branched-chain-amino-acid transaminase n=1 Tax=Filimonas lacunae TaxID=477680 RepID=A0A173M9E1_9BACT|nr:aminotransferase class IV [Filimonas lacunae]BAV04131.1 aminodeoxychorismate lyase [Filimonas lacunae]SIT15154.1 branched-chain amino acid aminotransferase [Filimonas lacunae]